MPGNSGREPRVKRIEGKYKKVSKHRVRHSNAFSGKQNVSGGLNSTGTVGTIKFVSALQLEYSSQGQNVTLIFYVDTVQFWVCI